MLSPKKNSLMKGLSFRDAGTTGHNSHGHHHHHHGSNSHAHHGHAHHVASPLPRGSSSSSSPAGVQQQQQQQQQPQQQQQGRNSAASVALAQQQQLLRDRGNHQLSDLGVSPSLSPLGCGNVASWRTSPFNGTSRPQPIQSIFL